MRESARERARWLEGLGRMEDAVRALADAFTIPMPTATDAARARDRGHMGELFVKAKGSEAGLGDLVLEAYDRNAALLHARELRLRANDPNAQLTDPMEFTLGGVDGSKFHMSSLKGKAIVLDFWATWCGPCRAQHPLYQQVKQRFRDNPDVVFLAIDNDEDRAAVKPFLAEVKWQEPSVLRRWPGARDECDIVANHDRDRSPRADLQPHEWLRSRAVRRYAERADQRSTQ